MDHDQRLREFLVSRLEQTPQRLTRPSVSLLQGKPYTNAASTDIRATLDKARQAMGNAAPVTPQDKR